MKNLILIAAAAALLAACQPKQPETVPATTPAAAAAKAPAARKVCYELREGKSVARAELTFAGDTVTGPLEYLFAEKDQSRGHLEGFMHGDTLRANYRFSSEGRQTNMEVIFLVQGNLLIQGHGPMGEYKGMIIYLFPDKVEFSTVFKAKTC